MALIGLWLLYYVFLFLFGNTGLTPLDEAGGRTSSTGTRSASAGASTLTVKLSINEGYSSPAQDLI